MMRWMVEWSLKFRRIVVAAAAGVVVFGIAQLDEVKTDVLPEFSPVTVEVQTEALGLSAAEVERLITIPLEQDLLSGVAFLESIESLSLPGLSSVVMTFEPGTDLLDARQVVTERLAQAAGLPQVANPPQMLQPLSSTGRVAMVSLSSDELTPIETSVLARWVVVPRLLGVEGVANVSIWGFRDRQLQVLVDPARLSAQGVTLGQVISTAGNALEVSPLTFLEASSPGTGGFIDTVNQRLHVFHEQAISTPDELAQVALEDGDGGAVYVDGRPLTLGEVTQIVTDHQPLIGDALCKGGPCVLLVIEKFPDANTPQVASNIDAALRALRPGLVDIEIDSSMYRPAAFISTSFNNLGRTLLLGGILVLLMIGVFLYDWRALLVSAVSIATSLVGAGLVLYAANVTVNAMTVAGLVMALLVIVDDAIVGVWGMQQPITDPLANDNGASLLNRVGGATLRTRSAALYSAVIVGAAAATFFFLDGEGGAFLPHIASAYLLALALALVTSLTVAPALSAFLVKGAPNERRTSPLARSLRAWYKSSGPAIVTKTGWSILTFAVLIGAALVALPFIDQSLRPDLKQRDVLIEIEAPAGTSLTRMDEIAAQIAFEVVSLEGVANFGAHVGRAITSDQVVNVNSAEVWVTIAEAADYAATFTAIESAVLSGGDVTARVTTYSDQRVTEILSRSDDEFVVRVYGEDSGVLHDVANRVLASVASVQGVRDAKLDVPIEEPTIEIEIDLDRTQAVGLKPGDVRRRAATLLSGIVVGNLFEDQKVFDVVVWGAPGIRQTVDDVRDLLIPTPSGASVTLGEVGDIRVVPNVAMIRHESVATYLDVRAGVVDRDLTDVAADVDVALAQVPFPLEYHAEVLGGFADQREARSRVVAVIVAALIGIFVLLQAALNSWRLAFLLFATLPMALTGGVFALLITGRQATLGSVAGLVALVGLAARATILMIQNYQERERAGEQFGPDLIVGGTTDLIVPTLVSPLAMVAVFLPVVIAGPLAGLEIVGPMAVVILGGLITTVLLALIVVPAFYLRWGFVKEPDTDADDLFDDELSEIDGWD
jgi:Cu/Ag efflux pump CusA